MIAPFLLTLILTSAPGVRPDAPGRAQGQTVAIDAVGDVMLGWRVSSLVQQEGADAPFAAVKDILGQSDAVIGNLECPLSDRGSPTKSKSKQALKQRKEFVLRATPAAAPGLAHAGFAALTLANNHILDYGKDALDDTLAALHASGVQTAGAADDLASAWQPAYFERRGVRFALIGISEVIPRGYGATAIAPGVAPGRNPVTGDVDAAYLKMLAAAIRNAHASADVVIVYEHWGTELMGPPTPGHVKLAHAAIDAGASLVLGAHPHVLGPLESYHGGLIAYSLGNFVFDTQPGMQTRSAILQVTLRGPTVATWRAIPVVLERGVPKPAPAADGTLVEALLAGDAAATPPPTPAPSRLAKAPSPRPNHAPNGPPNEAGR
ncbi:MAG: CapA family protein [Candidatus Eremiobacteraeota bacterium]|nr:CapA family protein [Candidatus Eremiobacteraeota bacterium]MBV8364920.1 CapA family protein [Candidatus Eremiobacteraeota bacterium]